MRINSLNVLMALVGFLAISLPLFAHHGSAGYDMDKQLVMKGTVTEWLWANPHCFLKYDTADDKGDLAHWPPKSATPLT